MDSHSHPKFKVMTAILQFRLLNKPSHQIPDPGLAPVTALPTVHTYKGWVPEHYHPKLVHHLRTGAYTSLSLNRLADSRPATTAHELSLMPEALTVQSSG